MSIALLMRGFLLWSNAKMMENEGVRLAQVERVVSLMESGKSEASSCKEAGINRATFRAYALKHLCRERYVAALAMIAQGQIEKLEVAIEDMRSGKITAQVARVEIDARKWFASKLLPKDYGTHLQVTDGNGGPLTVVIGKLGEKLGEE